MTIKSRISEAQELVTKLEAMQSVFEHLESCYKSNYMKIAEDEDGNYVTDENNDYVYRDLTEDELNYYPWYDSEKAKKEREIFKQVLSYLENMK